jgi:hypothetical protein
MVFYVLLYGIAYSKVEHFERVKILSHPTCQNCRNYMSGIQRLLTEVEIYAILELENGMVEKIDCYIG